VEADWEVEIGGDAPVIDAAWAGFVDLRVDAERVDEIAEVVHLHGLRQALVRLNASGSRVWTAKCDVWDVDEFDRDELDAAREDAGMAVACYLDLLPRGDKEWASPETAGNWCEQCVCLLRGVSLRNCRADFVVRRAWIGHVAGLGITAYLTACGARSAAAQASLSAALAALVNAVVPASSIGAEGSQYNESNPGE
jgi:hypothetical protein